MINLQKELPVISFVLLLGTCWALGIVFGRISLLSGFPVAPFATFQALGIAAATMVAAALARELTRAGRRDIPFFVVSAFFLIVLPYVVTYLALSHIGASRVGLILTTTPIFTALIAMAARTEAVRPVQLAGILCGFVGVLILGISDTSAPTAASSSWKWTVFATISPLSYALANILCFKLRPAALASIPSALGTNIIAALGLGAVSIATQGPEALILTPNLPQTAILFMLLAVAANSVGSVAFFLALPRLGAVGTSGAGYVSALVAGVLGVTFLEEAFDIFTLGATMFVVAGVVLSSRPSWQAP